MFKALENAYEFAPLPLRIGLAAFLITSGVLNAINPAGAEVFMQGIGLPAPMAFAMILMASQLVCGACILLGLLTRLTAAWLTLVFLLLAIMAYVVNYNAANLTELMKHAALIGATVCLMLSGPGKPSLDEKYFWE
ncbi:MAG: DoxX family protein [Candidatus Woesearchaeota archaeon]